jgi:hypothetical protein
MSSMGGSRFGSSFFRPEALQGNSHFRIRRCSRNWIPENHYHGLRLISLSMSNVINFMRVLHGTNPSEAPVICLEDLNAYRYPWRQVVGPVSFNLDLVVSKANIEELTKEEILAVYERASSSSD